MVKNRSLLVMLALSLGSCGARHCHAGVLPPGSIVAGKSIGAWTADWWNWAGSFPAGMSPIVDDRTGALANLHQGGPVFFVPGSNFGIGPVSRDFTVPGDKYVLIPVLNFIVANGVDDPAFKTTRDEAIAVTNGAIDPSKLFAQIDGGAVTDLATHREATPGFFSLTTQGGFPGVGPKGTYGDAFGDGYWLMLTPLGPGTHVLHVGGTTLPYTSPTGGIVLDSFSIDVTARVSVVPEPASILLLGVGCLASLGGAASRGRRRPHA